MLVESAVLLLSFAPMPKGDERGASTGPSKTSYSSSSDLTKADFQKASFTTTGTNAEIDFSGAKLNDANFKEAVVKVSGKGSEVKNDPTA